MIAAAMPNVEERLTAAAYTILTDARRHSHDAERWAMRFLDSACHGRTTVFLERMRRARARAGACHG